MVKFFRLGLWAFMALGAGVMAIGLVLLYQTNQFKNNAKVVQGSVVDLVEKVSHSEEGTSVVYAPRIAFRTAEGEETGFVSDTGSNPPAFHPGDTVEVMYQPGHAEEARINTFWQLYLGPVICLGIGSAFLIITAFVFMLVRPLLRENTDERHAPVGGLAFGRR